jgi:DNA sulfur modification protein DndC
MTINSLFSIDEKIADAKEKILKVYNENDRPWVIGYSGGKDSSAIVHLVLQTISELPLEQRGRRIYVVSSDTLVETPLIKSSIKKNHEMMEHFGKLNHMKVSAHLVHPRTEETFWVNIIGKGYPSPNQTFRWCTDRMKISPINDFIKSLIDQTGEVIMVLGVRKGESSSRDRVIESHSYNDTLLMRHTTLTNAFVFAPIMDFTVDDVWNVLLNTPSPWGADNSQLYELYRQSNSGGECPLIVDESIKETAGSCGNSRFGCWVCTVVNQDKALTGFIESGHTWLKPLRDFRDNLAAIRDDRSKRSKQRANGSVYFAEIESKKDTLVIAQKGMREKVTVNKETGFGTDLQYWTICNSRAEALEHLSLYKNDLGTEEDPRIILCDHEKYFVLGLGPFTIETRKQILKDLLQLQVDLGDKLEEDLISIDELRMIGRIWMANGLWDNSLKEIYESITHKEFSFGQDEISFLDKETFAELEKLCLENNLDLNIISKLLYIEKNNIGLIRRTTVMKDIGRILKQDSTNL